MMSSREFLFFFKYRVLFALVVSFCSTMAAQAQVDTVKLPCGYDVMYGIHYASNQDEKAPTLLLLHGFPGGFDDVLGIGEAIASKGINVFTLTFRGVSISEGKYEGDSPIRDVYCALNYLFTSTAIERYNIDTSQIILGGWSFGGGISLYVGSHDDRVKQIISIAGFNGEAFLEHIAENPDYERMMKAMFLGHKFAGTVNFNPARAINDIQTHRDKLSPVSFADKIAKKPLLIFGATDDREVSVDRHIMPYYQAVQAAGGDAALFIYETTHRFGGFRDAMHDEIVRFILEK